MRVYVPAIPSMLADLARAGELAAPQPAFAVTPELSLWVDESSGGDPDNEEYEYAAMGEASRHSLRRLADVPDEAPCRVVIAADVPDRWVESVADGWPGEVLLTGPLAVAHVVSLHVDDPDAAETVAAATLAVRRADDGHEASEQVVAAADEDELLWYAGPELALLVSDRRFGG